jgi:hypothetical protein
LTARVLAPKTTTEISLVRSKDKIYVSALLTGTVDCGAVYRLAKNVSLTRLGAMILVVLATVCNLASTTVTSKCMRFCTYHYHLRQGLQHPRQNLHGRNMAPSFLVL